MPEAQEPKQTPKSPIKPAKRVVDDEATDAIAQAAMIADRYKNHIVIGLCLAILGVFGWRWWSGQKSLREAWAWEGLKEGSTIQQLENAVEAYKDTGASPYLRLELGKKLDEDGKFAEAKKVYDELQTLGEGHLAAQIARARNADLRNEEAFLKLLPGKLLELAKNTPSALPVETNQGMGQQEAFGPPRDLMTAADGPPK